MRKLVEAMPKAAMQPARTPMHPRRRCTRPPPHPLHQHRGRNGAERQPEMAQADRHGGKLLVVRQHLADQPAERHHDCGVCTAERLRDRPARWRCAWRGGLRADGAGLSEMRV